MLEGLASTPEPVHCDRVRPPARVGWRFQVQRDKADRPSSPKAQEALGLRTGSGLQRAPGSFLPALISGWQDVRFPST